MTTLFQAIAPKSLLRAAAAAPFVVAAFIAAPVYADEEGDKRAESYFKELIKDTKVKGSWESADMDGDALVIKKIVIKGPKKDGTGDEEVRIQEIRLNKYDWDNPSLPLFADFEWKGITVPGAKTDPEAKAFLDEAGVETLTVHIKSKHAYDKATKVLTLDGFEVKVEKLFTLGLSFKINDLDLDAAKSLVDNSGDKPKTNDAAGPMALLSTLKIANLKLSLDDQGLMDGIVKTGMKKQNLTYAQAQAQMLAPINGMLAQAKDKLVIEAMTAIRNFVQNKGTITIAMTPAQPVPAMMFLPLAMASGKPQQAQMLQMMGIKITTEN